jgi:hypothetical protein
VQSGCFINISSEVQLHLFEAFKNVVPNGHDRYDRIYLKVWESDSPSFFRKAATARDGRNAKPVDNDSVCTDKIGAESKAAKPPKKARFFSGCACSRSSELERKEKGRNI